MSDPAPFPTPLPAPVLTVAIATTAARLPGLRADHLPALPGLCYHVFVQGADLAPSDLSRPDLTRLDIRLSLTEGRGAARNRNAALLATQTALLLFADDDLAFSAQGLRALMARFQAESQADFICARLTDETGRLRKRYSPDGQPVRWWNCGKVGTPELALRPAAFRARGLGFDTRFGAGMVDHLGDEYIFLCDALRAGLRGLHVGLVLASHPALSSGTARDPATMDIRKRVLIRALGRWKSHPARLVFALRHRRQFDGWRAFWRFV